MKNSETTSFGNLSHSKAPPVQRIFAQTVGECGYSVISVPKWMASIGSSNVVIFSVQRNQHVCLEISALYSS